MPDDAAISDPVTGMRAAVVARLWGELQRVRPEGRALIALDGFDGVGKTHLARELAEHADAVGGRALVSVGIDGFHRPRAERLRAGAGPEGFYRGSYRYRAFFEHVVDPLRFGEAVVPAIWDVARDEPVPKRPRDVPPTGIVVVDGIFLHRPELVDIWDDSVWVSAPFSVTVPRGNARFPRRGDDDPESPANRRYVEGQRMYLREADPESHAGWLFDNTDLDRPSLRHGLAEAAAQA
ncbi:uridine kinase [Agromyces archimandritae]|uniref:Uridine kinase n=1 Tax=Agromyces archimandritae TaxID=2781962 RepID=A0A975IND7_9MICO|nr:uridine kinase [Agromyces archimandritae]QTX04460.1 uridine kinase [Agromyces archimandritae]